MSLHQLVANARWKIGKRPVWLSIFPSSLQLCCVKSQTGKLDVRCGSCFSSWLVLCYCGDDPQQLPLLFYQAFDCLRSYVLCNISEVIMWQPVCLYTHVQHSHPLHGLKKHIFTHRTRQLGVFLVFVWSR